MYCYNTALGEAAWIDRPGAWVSGGLCSGKMRMNVLFQVLRLLAPGCEVSTAGNIDSTVTDGVIFTYIHTLCARLHCICVYARSL